MTMNNEIESTVELAMDNTDLRCLLDAEILLIAGGDTIVGLY